MNSWFTVKVKYTKQLENGSLKRVNEPYLLAAMTFTDAEARIYEELSAMIRGEFMVTGITRTDLQDIFQYEDSANWFKCKITYGVDEEDGEKKKKVAQNFLKEKGIDTSKTDSLVFVTATDVWMRSNAVLHICAALKGAWSWFGIFRYIPESVRDSLYDFIAKNRYRWFGKSDSCPSPNPLFKDRFIDC